MGLSERKELVTAQLPAANSRNRKRNGRELRRLQMMMNMVMSVISQDQDLTVEEAAELAANPSARR